MCVSHLYFSIKVARLVCVVGVHQGQIFLQNHPNVRFLLQLVANDKLHVNHLPVFKSHSLGQTWILIMEVLIAMQGDIRQPSDFLSASATEN